MKIVQKFVIILAAVIFSSCGDDFLDLSDPGNITNENISSSIDLLNGQLTALYASQHTIGLHGKRYFSKLTYPLAKTQDMAWTGDPAWNQLVNNEVLPNNDYVGSFWTASYAGVQIANDLIANIKKYNDKNAGSIGEEDAARLKKMNGEAHFLRAWHYFNLIGFFGDSFIKADGSGADALGLPLILTPPKTLADMLVARSTVGEVYDQIIKDFTVAETDLPATVASADLGRVTNIAAKAYLGKVHLFKEDWINSIKYFKDVIDNSGKSLMPFNQYKDMFNEMHEFNNESIYEINYIPNELGGNHNNNNPSGYHSLVAATMYKNDQGVVQATGWGNVYPHDKNIARFGSDPRLKVATLEPGVDKIQVSGKEYFVAPYVEDPSALGWSFRKYVNTNVPSGWNGWYGGNIHLIRLADVYLMYAEALNSSGTNDAEAREYLNKVRRRAYSLPVNTPDASVDFVGDGTALRDAIREERFKELYAEGHRWLDIVRWGIAAQEMEYYKSTRIGDIIFDPGTDENLPIPQAEMDANTEMIQNTGY